MIPAGPEPHPTSHGDVAASVHQVDLLWAEDYFGNREDPACLRLEPSDEAAEVPEMTKEIDDSLEMPTVEFPDKLIEKPEDITTEHPLSVEQRLALFEAVQQLPATKEGSLGRTSLMRHEIEILPGATAKKVPNYRWSPIVEGVIDAEVDRMKSLGLIEECPGAVDFLNPLLPIKKANGKWQICLDSRRLNQCTKRDEFPFPNMMGILQRIQKSKYFTVIDLSESYYQVPLERTA